MVGILWMSSISQRVQLSEFQLGHVVASILAGLIKQVENIISWRRMLLLFKSHSRVVVVVLFPNVLCHFR